MNNEIPTQQERDDERLVSRFMTTLADTHPEDPALAPAGQLWWRAQLSRRQTAAEKAMRPLVITETTAVAAVTLGCAVWLAAGGIPSLPTPFLVALVICFAGLCAASVALTVRSLIARD